MKFWDLPGPRSFLDGVESELRNNKNLVVAMPDRGPSGFTVALGEILDHSGWNRVSVQSLNGIQPADCLFEQLNIATESAQRRSPQRLMEALEPGQIVVIEGIRADTWKNWKSWVAEYEVASRAVSSFDRALLLLIVIGVPERELPTKAVALDNLVWRGVMSELDMLAYAGARVRDKGLEGVKAQLIAMTIARLSQWDQAVADILLEEDLALLFSPQNVLKELGMSYGWKKGLSPDWHSGTTDDFGGRRQVHSAFLALHDPTHELSMRIWSSQASSLLPLIELHRRALVPKIRHRLKMPVTIDGEQITDALDLEIGALAYLAGIHNIDPSIRAKLRKLRNIRNSLAHLDVLDASTALDSELLSPF
jgi:hypothetical protein